jgi:hypothetical protein
MAVTQNTRLGSVRARMSPSTSRFLWFNLRRIGLLIQPVANRSEGRCPIEVERLH